MDSGLLQRQELESIQKVVKQNKSKNRRIYLRTLAQKQRQRQEESQKPTHDSSSEEDPSSQCLPGNGEAVDTQNSISSSTAPVTTLEQSDMVRNDPRSHSTNHGALFEEPIDVHITSSGHTTPFTPFNESAFYQHVPNFRVRDDGGGCEGPAGINEDIVIRGFRPLGGPNGLRTVSTMPTINDYGTQAHEMIDDSDNIPTTHFTPLPNSSSTQSVSYFRFTNHREAELLMHYLDHVFALQFRLHIPSVAAGGRGWLLWLLTETPPFHRAAISLGALHQHSLLNGTSRGARYYDAWNELTEHHNRALSELQLFLQTSYASHTSASDRMRKLQVLACGVAFISFELFRGGVSWEPHLNALTTILSSMAHDRFNAGSRTTRAEVPRDSASAIPKASHTNTLADTAEHFLTGAIIWFESLSVASTAKAPKLLEDYETLLADSQVDLANVAGFHNWIATIIGEIGALREWKTEAEQSNNLSFWKLFERGDDIRKRLSTQIQVLRSDIARTFPIVDGTQIDAAAAYMVMADATLHAQAVRRAVTLVFAHAAQVYLFCTTSEPNPALEEISSSVSATASALQDLRAICDSQVLRSLVWPICIAGCMASESALQGFFQGLIEGLGEEAHVFGNSRNVLKVMQTCWEYRAARASNNKAKYCDWMMAMELNGQRILLV